MSYKKLYFENRNLDLSKYKRDYFGSREIDTIKFIFKNFYDHVISENAYILDLGSGDNFLKSTILKNNWNYKSLDIDNLNFEKDKFMFENNTFDVIISLAVIEHLDDPSIFLREIYRVLKNNGILKRLIDCLIHCQCDVVRQASLRVISNIASSNDDKILDEDETAASLLVALKNMLNIKLNCTVRHLLLAQFLLAGR